MIEGWLHHIKLTARARGIGPALALWGCVIGVALAVTLIFLTMAAYIWLERRYDSLTAALVLAGCYLLVTAIAAMTLTISRRRSIERARRELDARKAQQAWIDPRLLVVGLEIGRSLGWKKGLPLAAVGMLAAGIAREWSAHRPAGDTQN